jgi:DNA-binding CsgD family transcriptional regulator
MQMPGNAAQSKSKFGRKNVRAISKYLASGTRPLTDPEGIKEKKSLSSDSAQASSAGFLLLDAALRPLYANQEALSALAYPTNLTKNNGPDSLLESRVQALFEGSNGSRQLRGNGSLTSGRRRYQLRVFSVRSPLANGFKPAVAILFERNKKPSIDLSNLSKRFRLTPREVETVEHLVRGFNTQQIAERMGISPNTVKAFLRSIMMKMAADSRAGIIARILQT